MSDYSDFLHRFFDAQEDIYENVIRELKGGVKRSHWVWFIFPQIAGLGHSSTAKYFELHSLEEVQAYLKHLTLGTRIVQCTEIVLTHIDVTALEIFGDIDELKFRSSMTLFAHMTEQGSVFEKALDQFFDGIPDHRTLEIFDDL